MSILLSDIFFIGMRIAQGEGAEIEPEIKTHTSKYFTKIYLNIGKALTWSHCIFAALRACGVYTCVCVAIKLTA